jgi:hypothetical protein
MPDKKAVRWFNPKVVEIENHGLLLVYEMASPLIRWLTLQVFLKTESPSQSRIWIAGFLFNIAL